jgi:hypothetical protein
LVPESLKHRPNLEASAQKTRDAAVLGVFQTIKAVVCGPKNVSNIGSATVKSRKDVAVVATQAVKAPVSGAPIRVSVSEKGREDVAAGAAQSVKALVSGAAIRVSATQKAREDVVAGATQTVRAPVSGAEMRLSATQKAREDIVAGPELPALEPPCDAPKPAPCRL